MSINSCITAPAITAGAASRMKVVNSLAEVLADEMQAIHGGEWRVQIDHEREFVFVTPCNELPIVRPQRGGVV